MTFTNLANAGIDLLYFIEYIHFLVIFMIIVFQNIIKNDILAS